MTDETLAMRLVCRSWCKAISERINSVTIDMMDTVGVCPERVPCLARLQLGPGSTIQLSARTSRVCHPHAVVARGAASVGTRSRSRGVAPATPVSGSASSSAAAVRPRGSSVALGQAGPPQLLSLHALCMSDSANHLDVAMASPNLAELHVTGPGPYGNQIQAPERGRRASGGSKGKSGGSGSSSGRRSALDCTLSSLSHLRRLHLANLDTSAARLCSALMGLQHLTSLRLDTCRMPLFLARGRVSTFGMQFAADLAKLRVRHCGRRGSG